MKTRRKVGAIDPNRPKRKVASRKKIPRVRAVVVREQKPINYRVALTPAQRRLSFGDRWDYAPAPEKGITQRELFLLKFFTPVGCLVGLVPHLIKVDDPLTSLSDNRFAFGWNCGLEP